VAKPTPIIAPSLARKAVSCIKKAAAGIEALSESDLAISMAVYTISSEVGLERSDVVEVLKTIAELPQHCLAEADEEDEKPRRRRRAKKKK
jgi:hypothetical protein